MNYEDFLDIYHTGPEAVFELLKVMSKTIVLLEAQLNMNSRNSSKPPSTDEFCKPKSRRKKSTNLQEVKKAIPGIR